MLIIQKLSETFLLLFYRPNDLFCIVRIGPMQFETPVVFDSLNPFWDCSHTSPVHDISEPIRVELFDRDALSADDYIGAIEFRVRDVALDRQLNGLDKWLPISRVASGALHFRCTFLRLRWTLSIRELRSAQRLLHSSALKFPLGVLSVYVYSIKLYESIIQSDSPPVLQLRHNGLSFESSPLVNWTDETIGRKKEENLQRSYPVEERFQFNLMDPWHEIVVLDVLDTTGFRPSDLAALRVFDERSYGRCTLSVKTLLERQARLLQSLRTQDRTNNTPGSSHLSASDHGLRLEFELFPKYYSNSNDRKPIGRIRLFARLSFVCVPPKVFQNLQRKPHIRADPFQPTSTMSFVRRLVMKPTHSLRHPIHTLRTLRPPDLPALLQITRTRVTDDRLKFDPPRTYQDSNECHVSLRFEWSEHKRLYVHVLGVTSPPKEAIKYGVKFYVRLILVALNISTSSTKTFDSKESLPIDSKIQDGSTSTALTRRSYLVKPTNLIPIGQRLTVELDPRRHIDSHRLTVQLLFKQHFTSIFCLRCYSNPTILIASGQLLVPSIAFRSEPIDRWIQLKRISQK